MSELFTFTITTFILAFIFIVIVVVVPYVLIFLLYLFYIALGCIIFAGYEVFKIVTACIKFPQIVKRNSRKEDKIHD